MPTLVLTSNTNPGNATWTDSTLLPGGGINQLTGDVLAGPGTGSQPASVVALQGNPVSAVAPAFGEALVWDGTQWLPTPGGGGGGTIGGTIAATQVAFGTGPNAIGGAPTFTYDSLNNVLALDQGANLTGILVRDTPLVISSDLQSGVLVLNSSTEGATLSGVGVFLELRYDTLVGQIPTIRAIDETTASAPLDLVIGELRVNSTPGAAGEVLTSNGPGLAPTWQAAAVSGIDQLTGDVVAGPGSGSQAATVQGMGGAGSKVHFVIVGGQYATLQDAVNSAAANDVIVVGPIGPVAPASSWGDVTFPAQKRLTVIGMDGARGVQANIGKVTFSPAAGGTILENIVQLENLFINASFAGSQGVEFGGSDPARLRIVNCYIFNTAATGNGVVVNNSGAGSSCYIDGTTIQGAGTAGSAIQHTQGYTLIKSGTEVSDYQYQLECAAGLVEVSQSKFLGSLANEVVRITGGTVFLLNSTTLQNTTANASGVNITAAGAAFGMTNSTFAIATGTGYCVRGVAGGVFLYGQINYSNSAALAYNVKLQNTLTAFAVTQAFTLAP